VRKVCLWDGKKKKCGQRSGFSFLCIFAKASKVPADSIFLLQKAPGYTRSPVFDSGWHSLSAVCPCSKKTCDFLNIDLSHFWGSLFHLLSFYICSKKLWVFHALHRPHVIPSPSRPSFDPSPLPHHKPTPHTALIWWTCDQFTTLQCCIVNNPATFQLRV
jgi:hypothetical protein